MKLSIIATQLRQVVGKFLSKISRYNYLGFSYIDVSGFIYGRQKHHSNKPTLENSPIKSRVSELEQKVQELELSVALLSQGFATLVKVVDKNHTAIILQQRLIEQSQTNGSTARKGEKVH